MSEKTIATSVAPVQALVIGGTGDGGVRSQDLQTPAGQPNVVLRVVSPLVAITVRFVDTFLTVLVSLVTAGMTTNLIPATDFMQLVQKCALLSVAGAGLGFLKDLLTIFGKLKQKFPLLDL